MLIYFYELLFIYFHYSQTVFYLVWSFLGQLSS